MAKRVKTDLFEGIMKAPEKKTVATKTEEKKAIAPVKSTSSTKKSTPAKKAAPVKKTTAKPEPIEPASQVEVKKSTVSLEQFLKKTKAPSSKSHTFYLKDTVFEKLVQAADYNGTTPSKLLEALIEMNL